MNTSQKLKRAAIPRAGYDFQDLAGIEVLIKHYRDPDLYDWVALEADDALYSALDDVVAARKDGSFELVQVKFTADAERYALDWSWLVDQSGRAKSLLAKWCTSFQRVAAMGRVHSAVLKTNRLPDIEFSKCLRGTRVDFDLIPSDIKQTVSDQCGGEDSARAFFDRFDFLGGTPDVLAYESSLRDQLVPSDTDMLGWHVLLSSVRRWATLKNQPEPDGRISRAHVLQVVTKKRPLPIRQDFIVPEHYLPPNEVFDAEFRVRIRDGRNPLTILWGTPGLGKSTYLSYVSNALQEEGAAVVRHHYFLAAEDSTANRTSFVEIATSLTAQLYARHPDAMSDVADNFSRFRESLTSAATNLAGRGQRLFVVIDGLDHVWREVGHVQQLDRLFNELFPLPENVSLIIGTQRVSDEHLPRKLLMAAQEADWIAVPRMDEVTVHRWVTRQNDARPLILRFNPDPERRKEMLEKIAAAFFNISQGHPLHLIYAYQSVLQRGAPVSADDIEALPNCPDGDIRQYYQGIWVRLDARAKNTLHMLAGTDFFWPGIGVRQVLGEYSAIEFLLEFRNIGLVPFHASLFAWVRDRKDHLESYAALCPRIIAWLEDEAPPYWKWGWLWVTRARSGDASPLLLGATRDWVVNSLVMGWPIKQIENILGMAERMTFSANEFSRTIYFRSLKTRVSNARQSQSRDFASYRAIALAISQNHQQTLNLIDEVQTLDDGEVLELARKGPHAAFDETRPACFAELVRRVNTWIRLRHRSEHEFDGLSGKLLAIVAYMEKGEITRTLSYVRQFKPSAPQVTRFIGLVADAQNASGLEVIREHLLGDDWSDQRRLIDDELHRIASFRGVRLAPRIVSGESASAYLACTQLLNGQAQPVAVHMATIPVDLARERYSLTGNSDVEDFYVQEFWAALRVGLLSEGRDYDNCLPGLSDDGNTGWLLKGLDKLISIARSVAGGHLPRSFSAVYTASRDVEVINHGPSPEREHAQYRAFRDALRRIAVDLHFLGLGDSATTTISLAELQAARQSPHWHDDLWVQHNIERRMPILAADAAEHLLTLIAERQQLVVSDFSERAENWTNLADLAVMYRCASANDYLRHAAECLVGYGYHKDTYIFEVIDALSSIAGIYPERTRGFVQRIAPIVESITEFTDGDETHHARSEFIELLAKVALPVLPSLYEHYLSDDDHSLADKVLLAFGKVLPLEHPEGAALARTFLDDRALTILENRADAEPVARTLLTEQNEWLGRRPRAASGNAHDTASEFEHEAPADSVDPASFGAADFAEVAAAGGSVSYRRRREFLRGWLGHWRDRGQGKQALASIEDFLKSRQRAIQVEDVLDDAFLVSVAVHGKEVAYRWLVQAHILRYGWSKFWTSEEEAMHRLARAVHYYPDRWEDYIRDTGQPSPTISRPGDGIVIGYSYLVRYLLMAGQADCALRVTESLVQTLVEEVREQPLPKVDWFRERTGSLSLDFLFARLKWPVPRVRWQVARQICHLATETATAARTTARLLEALAECEFESETCALLSILHVFPKHARPGRADVIGRVRHSSMLADMLLQRLYGDRPGDNAWLMSEASEVPNAFTPASYFEKYSTSHVPAMIAHQIRGLQRTSRQPFWRQWAYEWQSVCERSGAGHSLYTHYFGDSLDAQAGVMGQYWQRMREVYISAYLRTLAHAVKRWGMPLQMAQEYCLGVVEAVDGVFQLTPGNRPSWLADIPERCCAPESNLAALARSLRDASCEDGMVVASITVPIVTTIQRFARLDISSHLVTPDFEPADGEPLGDRTFMPSIEQTFSLRGSLPDFALARARQDGAQGDAVPVCTKLMPMPFGCWHMDLYEHGLVMPARYMTGDVAIHCLPQSIELRCADSAVQARMTTWNEDWTPQHPIGGSTRIGAVAMVRGERLDAAQREMKRRLMLSVRLETWDRESEYGAYRKTVRGAFLVL